MNGRITTASLDDPLYYLANFETVVHWVATHHGDLLTYDERTRLDRLQSLSQAARALLVRLVMRSGELFRLSKLNYPELGVPESEALDELAADGWTEDDPELAIDELFRLLTVAECRHALAPILADCGLPRAASKKAMLTDCLELAPAPRRFTDWWPDTDDRLVALHHMALFDRIRLMFFGNLRQSWSDFVLVELGHHQYETVPFTPDSRAFQQREAVDRYLLMQACRDRLEGGEPPADIWPDIPARDDSNPWLESRRGRLLMELGRQADRQGDAELALAAWSDSGHREARLRHLRLLERQGRHQEAWDIALSAQAEPRGDGEAQGLERLMRRLARKVDQAPPERPKRPSIPEMHLTLPQPAAASVEWAVLQDLDSEQTPVCYVENTLINGLFGLLCWPALFAPLPGAFFHPFHIAPADLHREDFVSRRQALFDDCLAALDSDEYKDRIRRTWGEKHGITSAFVAWPALSEPVLELALHCIPAADLKLIFQRLLRDLRDHRSGLPDLIRFHPEQARYDLIEVKGPGDRLQDHQIRWLEFCLAHDIAVSVCYVRWQEAD
ncbi:VRR-NUC domain-containing protein [Marinobacter sp. R17]|uniref:VRR-NUC domain-containing protein n=1 Tax=Marinobacter sp. R17 TaxID=2484250 RepID=UPI000F4CE97C|nr:VRR-NUC domain-containing protein [Marinobacter sp. R17]ROT96351.1 VRR-NUC domain-containing protein [Marinobacter sp. R17]